MSLHVLGRVRLVGSGEEIPLPARQLRRLVAALAVRGGSGSRSQLVDDLWDEAPPRSADKVLQQYVSQLRRAAPRLQLTTTETGYALPLIGDICDVRQFEQLVAIGRRALLADDPGLAASVLRRADALWSGPAYDEFAHEAFAEREAVRLEDLRREALEDRWEAELALGRHASLHARLTALAAAEPLRERLQGLAMLAAYRAGDQGAALEVFRGARQALVDELGVDPGPALRDLQRRILEQDPTLVLPTVDPDRRRHNLPAQTSSFVGREGDLAQLVGCVLENRLVTLTGFGGMGKTRLALQAAAGLAEEGVGDVWFVDLTSVTDPALVPARVAEVLDVRWGLGEPAAALIEALRDTPTLLVLDNLEQVLGCARFVAELLERAPAVRVLCTSREPLRIRGEHQIPLPPLSLPGPQTYSADDLFGYEAVRLFVDRAVAVRSEFVVDSTTAPAVAAICARLDGHPLALELAAARLKVLSVEDLLGRLDGALSLLTGGSRDMPERHQTLRATIASSYDALSSEEQLLLRRMAVLPAAADLHLVEKVCGEDLDVLDLLEQLVNKSLVVTAELNGQTRFGLLVSIRQYATEQTNPTTLHSLADRHAEHIHATLTGFDANTMAGYRQLHNYVNLELAHIRAALSHRQAHGPTVRFVELVVELNDTFLHRGLPKEMAALGAAALTKARGLDPPAAELIAELLTHLVFTQIRFPVPLRDFAVEAVAAGRQCRDPVQRAEVLSLVLRFAAASLAEARALLAETDEAINASAGRDELRVSERHAEAAVVLRYADPAGAEKAARDIDRSDLMARPVRRSETLLDRGEFVPALEVLADASDRSYTGAANPSWAARIAAAQSSALTLAGRFEESRAAVSVALSQVALTGAPPLAETVALADLERATGDPQAGVAAIDAALSALPAAAMAHLAVVALRWRRVVCLRQLGQPPPPAELADCRGLLAADELYGPRDLLAVLVERAVEVADTDPEKAATLVAAVQAHRGRWVLPFGMDNDLQALLPHLPPLPTPPPLPTEVW